MATLYHCTWTRLVPRIRKQGLRVLQTSNWADGNGKRLGGGAIHAFESYWDAVRWAGRMDWDHNKGTGTGKVTILTLESAAKWDSDFNDPLSQAMGEGQWLKLFGPVPAAEIIDATPVTVDMVRELINHQNTTIQGH